MPIATFYVLESFLNPNPLLRIVLRCAPILPAAIWTLWLDPARPLAGHSPGLRIAGRFALLVAIMAFAVALLGLGLNWLYDPTRVL